MADATPLIPAATVVLARDGRKGLEALMLRRNSKLAFGGMWVFPGGRIDDEDRLGLDGEVEIARRAAVREAAEETGLTVDPSSLSHFSVWIPPPIAPKRFRTWFFLASAPSGDVKVDMGEIHDHDWMSPADAIARRDRGDIELAPPTWITLNWLSGFVSVDDAAATIDEPALFETRIPNSSDRRLIMWAGDAGYESGEPSAPGRRHRLHMHGDWRYEVS
jgi:8-oxo-dGTP pyrophosphatase MutT (NUDIX family)